jgi:hypothetical protein
MPCRSTHGLNTTCGSCADRRPPPVPMKAAAKSPGSGRLHPQTELASTFPSTYLSSPACPSSPAETHLAGTAAAAATAAGRRRPHLDGPPPPQPSPGIGPLGPKGQSPPAPSRPRPAVRRNLAGPPPVGARGRHCKVCDLFGEFCAK